MYKHILLATDGSALSGEAAIQAMQTARKLDAKITAMTVVPGHQQLLGGAVTMLSTGTHKERFEERQTERANKILDEVKKAAIKYGVQCFSTVVFGGSPYEAIIKQAEISKCDLIVMASHGRRGLNAILLGSETQKVLVHSKIPVLVCRSRPGTAQAPRGIAAIATQRVTKTLNTEQ